jgi:hypothetical protein
MKKAKALYTIQRDGSCRVWYEGIENNSYFFGFLTSVSYDSAYTETDNRCVQAGYRLESFTADPNFKG